MTNRPHLEQARENAQVTYDRRQRRSAVMGASNVASRSSMRLGALIVARVPTI
jgi:hypothetical protein